MNRYVIFSSLLFSVSGLVACGGGSGGSTDSDSKTPVTGQATSNANANSSSTVTAGMLQGQWISDCDVDEDGTAIGNIEEFSGNEFAMWGSFYDDANCSYLVFEAGLLGNFTLGNATYATNGTVVTEIDALGHTLWLKPVDYDFTQYMNEVGTCGFTNWRVGEAMEVTKCSQVNETRNNFDIVQFDRDVHFLGENSDTLDGSSSSKRPKNIDYTVSYRQFFDDEISQPEQALTGVSRGTEKATLEFYLEKFKTFRSAF